MSGCKDFMEETLGDLPMVEWDRYVEWWDDKDQHWTKVYGWIEREKDSYKDFVVIQFNLSKPKVFDYITSSAKHDEEVHEALGFDPEESTKCKRVEKLPIKSNAIELESGK